MGMLSRFVLFSNSGKRKKIRVPCNRQHGCSSLFFHSLPQALYRPKRLFSSRGESTEGEKGHLSHLSMYLIVPRLSVYFPHTISSHSAPHPGCRFRDLPSIIPSPTTPHIYAFVFCFNFSQTVVVSRPSLWPSRVVDNICWDN